MATHSTWSSNPSGCEIRLLKLRANSPAPTARNNDSATWPTTSSFDRLSRAPWCVLRPLVLSAVDGEDDHASVDADREGQRTSFDAHRHSNQQLAHERRDRQADRRGQRTEHQA